MNPSHIVPPDFIRKHVPFAPEAYQCGAGLWTYGHGSTRGADNRPVKPGATITEAQAGNLLVRDLAEAVDTILFQIGYKLEPYEIDGLAYLIHDIGAKAFSQSPVLERLRNNDVGGAAMAFISHALRAGRIDKELVLRRQEEARVFAWGG